MRVMVTGAGGYIGSHLCKMLKQNGHEVVGIDCRPIDHDYCDARQYTDYSNVYSQMFTGVEVVCHIGATSLVGPSVTDPAKYYKNNVSGTISLLEQMQLHNIKKFVFASSAACYGEPEEDVCAENSWHQPCNPYGWSKRMMEIILNDYSHAYDLRSISLRFFNVAGADPEGEFGQEPNATHIIAKAIERTMAGKDFTLFGKDFDTPDGTCVRDYVHVEDVARGVLNSIELLETTSGARIFNLGGKRGYSNLEIIDSINRVTPLKVDLKYGDPRPGDPSTLVAETVAANITLNWKPKHNLDSIISTAYKWYNK
jgi:UDP-glucose-4-epimerase GalE